MDVQVKAAWPKLYPTFTADALNLFKSLWRPWFKSHENNFMHSFFFPVPLYVLWFAVSTICISYVQVSLLFPLSSALVSLSVFCPGFPSLRCIVCLWVPVVLSSVLVNPLFFHLSWSPLFSLSLICLVSCRFSLLSILMTPLVYWLSWCPVCSICPGVLLVYHLSWQPHCSLYHLSCCPLCFHITCLGIPSVHWTTCPHFDMFSLLPSRSSHCFLCHLLPCFVCFWYHMSLSPLSCHLLIGVCCTWTASESKQNKHTNKETNKKAAKKPCSCYYRVKKLSLKSCHFWTMWIQFSYKQIRALIVDCMWQIYRALYNICWARCWTLCLT